MKGFKSYKENLAAQRNGALIVDEDCKLKLVSDCSHFVSSLMQFSVDVKNDVYVMRPYGAFYNNIDANIKSVEEIKTYKPTYYKNPLYQNIIKLMNEGYEFVLGPAFPLRNGGINSSEIGLYCKNYLKVFEEKRNEQINIF